MPLKIILTGASGMVGEGVLIECLQNKNVSEVLMVNRKQAGVKDPKLKELILPDFLNAENFSRSLTGYDACFYCAGKSSVGMNEADYTLLTYDTTIYFARVLKNQNPDLVFNFVSGASTDSTEKGKLMWARVKGRTENALMQLFAGRAYNFRPGLMKPFPQQKNFYGYNRWSAKLLFPVLQLFFPFISLQQLGRAMINASMNGFEKKILEVKDIVRATGSSTL